MSRSGWLASAGAVLLLAGAAAYGWGFFYGLRFAFRPEDAPDWLGRVFPASMAAGALGLLLLAAAVITRRR
jgi:hypothetical protein